MNTHEIEDGEAMSAVEASFAACRVIDMQADPLRIGLQYLSACVQQKRGQSLPEKRGRPCLGMECLRCPGRSGRRMTSSLPIDRIKIDGGTQSRAKVDPEVVEEYAQVVRDGTDFPPVTVFHDGKKHWLADGFHRIAAYQRAGATDIAVAVHQGTRRDAVLFSVGANASHGLRRTNDDKRRAVTTLLNDKEWSAWSDRQIAKQCGVHHDMVGRLREELSGGNRQMERTVKRGDSTFTMDTAKIGKPEKSETSRVQEAFDRQRQDVVDNLSPEIQAVRAAAEIRRQQNQPEPDEDDLQELRNIIAAQEEELSDLRSKIALYDGMVAEFEKGGFDQIIAGLNARIENLNRQVQNESQEKVKNLRSADYWKKKAIEAGANSDIVIDMATGEMSRV